MLNREVETLKALSSEITKPVLEQDPSTNRYLVELIDLLRRKERLN